MCLVAQLSDVGAMWVGRWERVGVEVWCKAGYACDLAPARFALDRRGSLRRIGREESRCAGLPGVGVDADVTGLLVGVTDE